MKLNLWQHSLSALAIAGLTAPFIMPAAQAQLVGQARCAKQSTAIFAERSAASPVVRAIPENQRMTIAENTAENGFLAVSAPSKGFVQTVTLRLCPGGNPNPNPNPNPSPSTCRRVTQTQGLIVRQGPDVSTAVVGSVAFNSQVNVSTTPTTSKTDASGRVWVQISKPFAGWVSNGFVNVPGSNLLNCQ